MAAPGKGELKYARRLQLLSLLVATLGFTLLFLLTSSSYWKATIFTEYDVDGQGNNRQTIGKFGIFGQVLMCQGTGNKDSQCTRTDFAGVYGDGTVPPNLETASSLAAAFNIMALVSCVCMFVAMGLRASGRQMMFMKHRANSILSWIFSLAVVLFMLVTVLGYPATLGNIHDFESTDASSYTEAFGWSYWLMIPCSTLFIAAAVFSLMDFVVLSHENAMQLFLD